LFDSPSVQALECPRCVPRCAASDTCARDHRLALDGRAGGRRNSLAGRPSCADAVASRQRLAAAASVRRATARAWPRAKRGAGRARMDAREFFWARRMARWAAARPQPPTVPLCLTLGACAA